VENSESFPGMFSENSTSSEIIILNEKNKKTVYEKMQISLFMSPSLGAALAPHSENSYFEGARALAKS
jgi:hypothetical protein